MKFRKEYQTYLLIVIAIIIAGYFLKHFFFNKNKKVIEGQEGTTTTYYRVAFSSTDLINTDGLTLAQQDLLKELILMEYDASKIKNYEGNPYVLPATKYFGVIPATLLIKDAADAVLGLKVVSICGRLEYFNDRAAAAAAADATAGAAAVAAYDYARLILSNDVTYKADVNIMALIAAANLFTISGTDAVTATKIAREAAYAAFNIDSKSLAGFSAYAAGNAASNAAGNAAVASDAAEAAGYANAYANGVTLGDTTGVAVKENDNYKKVMAKYNNDPANLKAVFITAAGLIYQSVYTRVTSWA